MKPLIVLLSLAALAPGAQAQGSTSNCLAPPTLTPVVPVDLALTRQADANCFAWQEFIALNWAASATRRGQPDPGTPPARFGQPGATQPAVWETYKQADEIFLANARDPGQWNATPARHVKLLGGLRTRLSPEPNLDLSDIGQASQGHPWLTAQSGLLTLYERGVNEDAYSYIRMNRLYDADAQRRFARAPGINLPDGTASSAGYGKMGAIEIKAAWLELPNPADWPRFKISKAVVSYPGQPSRTVVVGLTGLHIIHKTALGQQFIWATFEHRQNAPDATQVAAGQLTPPYTYFNPDCNPDVDHYRCVPNADPAKVNGGRKPYGAPIQVVRTTPIATRPNNDVAGLNEYVWRQVIAPSSPDSAFLNYQLVNTLWSNQNTPVKAGARVPLPAPQLSPGASQEPVANTTMETYVQNLTCLACHASAPVSKNGILARLGPTKVFNPAIAGTAQAAQNDLASDYSFLFELAQVPATKTARGQHAIR